ncbi:MAG: enolase C-terminal domain-like protein [Bacteriovorax sp.]|jgi:L-alanine-DL-glutamate epimerase-like enolase superfamily enzyme
MKKRIISSVSIQIPFKAKFAHSSAIRESTETIIVEIKNENGISGFGESCPRLYVTRETISSAQEFIIQTIPLIEIIYSLSELSELQNRLAEEIDKNPSAWCALEMAMLDLLARENNESVESLLNVDSDAKTLPYSAVLGIDSFVGGLAKCLLYKALGFFDFKIKLSGNQAKDLRVLKLISFFSKSIRLDANNLFSTADEAISYLLPLRDFIWAIEEPVKPHALSEMKQIAQTLKIKIILDESFLNEKSLENIEGRQDIFIPNLRISKLGGVLRTLALVKKLEDRHFQWILGSHVGEMSLLTRASLLVSGKDHQNLIAKEGGFSTHLLSYDPFFPNLKLGRGALIKNKISDKTGWGMTLVKNK